LLRQIIKKNTTYNEVSLPRLRELISCAGLTIDKEDGMLWIPMSVNSNNPFVKIFEKIENILGLRNWISQSPMILFAVKKGKS
jgi:hypothetical protein